MPFRNREQRGHESGPPGPEPKRITPVDIQQKEFGLAFRGYNERDVDQFLDELTEEVARLYAENKRLREDVEFTRTSRLDLGGANEAEALLRQAREEAARIIGEARARVSDAEPGPTAGRGTAAALAPFVAQEREFLQSLATLIQAHAEGVKDQIRKAREAAAAGGRQAARIQAPGDPEPGGRQDEAREAAARAAIQEDVEARAAFQEAAERDPDEPPVAAAGYEGSEEGPRTQPWKPQDLGGAGSENWKDYHGTSSDASDEEGAAVSDEIVDLTERPDAQDVELAPDEREARERVRTSVEPQRGKSDVSDDDVIEDRSIRELFWGEDY
jgi:cell division initiation protein